MFSFFVFSSELSHTLCYFADNESHYCINQSQIAPWCVSTILAQLCHQIEFPNGFRLITALLTDNHICESAKDVTGVFRLPSNDLHLFARGQLWKRSHFCARIVLIFNLSQLFETLKGLSCDQLRAFRLLSNGIKTPHEFGTIGTIGSRVGCRDGVKTLRESSFKAMAVSDRLGTSCQVKYWLELCEIPPG